MAITFKGITGNVIKVIDPDLQMDIISLAEKHGIVTKDVILKYIGSTGEEEIKGKLPSKDFEGKVIKVIPRHGQGGHLA